ncbi:nucleotidyltransferase family protein [Thalassolituus sp. LLYu03]|uniref:nucleotidyltransferase family protein n=1 Tax=Thalassolituus sp. LLYu03 TaxID=3421656 RepID=UPI003D2D409F
MKQTGVVVLAAGSGERYGHDKRLAAVPGKQGHEPMLLATLRAVRASGLPFIVVLRSGDLQWEQELDAIGVDWIACPEAHKGMGHSLAAGVHATQHWDGWLIALADMPFIQPGTYRAVADALNQHRIVRPVLHNPVTNKRQPGHPVGFDKTCAFELLQCSGDQGARELLKHHASDVAELLCHDEGIVQDIDRPEDC